MARSQDHSAILEASTGACRVEADPIRAPPYTALVPAAIISINRSPDSLISVQQFAAANTIR